MGQVDRGGRGMGVKGVWGGGRGSRGGGRGVGVEGVGVVGALNGGKGAGII